MPINLIHFEQCQFSDVYRDKHGFTLPIVNFYTCIYGSIHAFGLSIPCATRQVFISFQVCVLDKVLERRKNIKQKMVTKTRKKYKKNFITNFFSPMIQFCMTRTYTHITICLTTTTTHVCLRDKKSKQTSVFSHHNILSSCFSFVEVIIVVVVDIALLFHKRQKTPNNSLVHNNMAHKKI